MFDTLVVLGDAAGAGMIEGGPRMEVDAAGQFYVFNPTGTEIKVFSPQGAYVRTIGRRGEGPGEFQMARGLHVDANGLVYVPDVLNARVSVFDPGGGLVRTVAVREPLPGFWVFPLPGDSLLIEGHSLSPDMVGYSVHVLSPNGARVRSLGDPPYSIPTSDPYYHHRAIAPAEPGRVWVGGWHRYQIELWDLAGTRMRRFVREPDWFVRPEQSADGPSPPRPSLNSLLQDSSGLLWTRSWAAADDWMDDPPDRSDTIIEVVDPDAGQWLASVRLPGASTNLFGDRLIGRTLIDLERSLVQIVVLRARLEAP